MKKIMFTFALLLGMSAASFAQTVVTKTVVRRPRRAVVVAPVPVVVAPAPGVVVEKRVVRRRHPGRRVVRKTTVVVPQ